MKHGFVLLITATALSLQLQLAAQSHPADLAAPRETHERIAAAFALALGRRPTIEEAAQWAQQRELTISEMLAQLRGQLERDPAMRRAVVAQACHDALGRTPAEEEYRAWTAGETADTYTGLMQLHVKTLRENPAEYEHVIRHAYQFVVQRDVYAEEISYWSEHGTLPYSLLVACIENWARRNQPGLMVTSGTPTVSVNSEFLVTVRLSPAIAAEARAAIGLVPAGVVEPINTAVFGRNLVAVGADNIVTAGRIHFVATGVIEPAIGPH